MDLLTAPVLLGDDLRRSREACGTGLGPGVERMHDGGEVTGLPVNDFERALVALAQGIARAVGKHEGQ
jgi:hypothetical protein